MLWTSVSISENTDVHAVEVSYGYASVVKFGFGCQVRCVTELSECKKSLDLAFVAMPYGVLYLVCDAVEGDVSFEDCVVEGVFPVYCVEAGVEQVGADGVQERAIDAFGYAVVLWGVGYRADVCDSALGELFLERG